MSTVAEIEEAMKRLPLNEKLRLMNSLGNALAAEQKAAASLFGGGTPHGILDIPVMSVGRVLSPDEERVDLLEEMLEDRI
jgi:hypothetical protein